MEEEEDLSPKTRSTYFPGCMASLSWFPPAAHRVHPRQFKLLRREGVERSRSLRTAIKRFLKDGRRSVYCRSKPLTFGYDEDSYAKNFEDGCRNEGCSRRFSNYHVWRVRAC